jgi:hypothetical protein
MAQGESATGFFFRWGNRKFLVSNWHVFSGKNARTGEYLHPECRDPYWVTLDARYAPSANKSVPVSMTVPLRRLEDGERLWSEHPQHGSSIDVAAVEIVGLPHLELNFANDDICDQPYFWGAGDQMYILGYPKGISGGANLPIWKSAVVASEPGQMLDAQPKFLVDAATTAGMSGSPVIFRSNAYQVPSSGASDNRMSYSIGATIQQLVGIYSGRVAKLNDELKHDPLAAQLGFVWRRETILDTVVAAATVSSEVNKLDVRYLTTDFPNQAPDDKLSWKPKA